MKTFLNVLRLKIIKRVNLMANGKCPGRILRAIKSRRVQKSISLIIHLWVLLARRALYAPLKGVAIKMAF